MIRKYLFLLVLLLLSCSSFAEPKTDQLQLQESLQRFYTRFTERTLEGFLKSGLYKNAKTHEESIRQYTLYDSEVLKIATGPYPEINLLDMLVFIKLNKMTIESYWVPMKWNEKGESILQAFTESDRDIEQIASSVLTSEQLERLRNGVIDWKKKNPKMFRVEKIRLDEVARVVPQFVDKDKDKESGFLNIKGAVKAVDQMVLVANRGIFVAQYMPMLLRLQTRIATLEVVDDLAIKYRQNQLDKKVGRSIASINSVSPLLDSAINLTGDMKDLSKDAKSLLYSYNKFFPDGINATENLKVIQSIVNGTNELLEGVKDARANNQVALRDLKTEFRNAAFFIAAIILGVGMFLSVFFWGCYYFFQKAKYRKIGEVV